jgi:hypothetical protein
VFLLPKLKTERIRLTQLNDDFGNTPEDAKKQIEDALPPSAENHRYESSAEFYGLVASGGRVFDWLKLQLKPQGTKVVPARVDRQASSMNYRQESDAK